MKPTVSPATTRLKNLAAPEKSADERKSYPPGAPAWKAFLIDALRQANYWANRRMGPGVRSVAGLLFIVGGVFGFLPILGFWMIPVGLFFIAMEVQALRKPLRTWINGHKLALRRVGLGT
jgi:hypothetical protein